LQDAALEAPQTLARFEAQVIDKKPSKALVCLERFDLSARAVKGEHQLRAHTFPERVCLDELLELGDQLTVSAGSELRVDAILEGCEAELGEPRDLGLGERLVGELLKWLASPERKSLG
jgi:hypothetical protein